MFKMTVVASKLREQLASYLEQVRGSDVLQILHRGDSVKVMMTQSHYLDLLSRLAVYEKNGSEKKISHKSVASIKATVQDRLSKVDLPEEAKNDSHRLGRGRTKTA